VNARYDAVTKEACLVAASAYLNGSNPRKPEVSPLFADLKGLPPLLIHADELEVLQDQIFKFAKQAQSAGVDVTFEVYKDMVHVWHMFHGFTPEAEHAINAISRFIKEKTSPNYE
jgi:epsilon-lactone hydrolase